jgi:peptidoglycan/LPS O-acetylase OafA/YrhL
MGVVLLPDHVFCTIAFFVLALALSKREYKIVVNRFTTYVGKISFSMYLSHFAVLHWLTRFHLIDYLPVHNPTSAVANYTIRLIIVLSASTLISTFLHHFIELPAQRIGYRIIKERETNS